MVHLRARNLPSKGRVVEWLFTGEHIAFGDDFALIKLDEGGEVKIKSNYNGMIVKTIKLGSSVKNGSILANIAIGEKEISKFKNRHFTKEGYEESVVDGIYLPENIDDSKFQSASTPADEFSGAVLYDKYNQAITPFSSSEDDLMDSKDKFEKLENKETHLKDKFAAIRENIKKSVKNAPQNKTLGDLSKEELLKMQNSDLISKDGENIFASDGAGPSKFRQMIQARKEKLLEENNFKETKEIDESVNAMTNVDEKGRPLILRNIIASRVEKLNEVGGDVKAFNEQQQKLSNINKTISQEEESAVSQTSTQSNDEFDNDPIDINDVSTHHGFVMPKKNPSQLVNEIEAKKNKSYAESRMTSLYDINKRWNLIKERDERNIIDDRRRAVEQGIFQNDNPFYEALRGGKIPKEFFANVPYQNGRTGETSYIPYNKTPKGKKEFEAWLRASNLYTAYKEGEIESEDRDLKKEQELVSNKQKKYKHETNELDMRSEKPLNDTQTYNLEEDFDSESDDFEELYREFKAKKRRREQLEKTKTTKNEYQQLLKELLKQGGDFKNLSGESEAENTINFLKKQVNDLQNTLIQQNQLAAATQKLNNGIHLGGGSDTFSQLMQYMIMQNLMQNMNTGGPKTSINEIKELIKSEIKEFTKQIKNSDKKDLDYIDKQRKNYGDMKTVNFESSKPENNLGHLHYEGTDINKVVHRKKVNENRNAAVKSMILSQSYIPPLTISTEIDMSSILKLKHMLKQTQNHIKFPTIAFIAKAISIALEEHPKLNSSYDPESNEILIKKYHNIGLATETSEGLIIPVLKFVEKLSVKEVAIDIKEMTQRLRSGELYNYETEGSTITVANYGNIGAIQATPTIFYPNAAVIGVGKVVKKPVVIDNEKLAIKAIMNTTLTVDQRIIDAAEAGRFLSKLKEILEKPEILTVS